MGARGLREEPRRAPATSQQAQESRGRLVVPRTVALGVVDRRDPTSCRHGSSRSRDLARAVRRLSLDLEDEHRAVYEPDNKIRLVMADRVLVVIVDLESELRCRV